LQLARRFRLPAFFCALAVLVCELISRPYANMSICDDGPYILMARTMATTGHVVYNGWAAPMLGWQLYLGAAFIKLFGFSFTTVRSSTLLVATALAFVLQRTLVRAGITDRNATIGTLALVLSPLYLMLSVTFMTDIFGLFAIVICFYGCLRALQITSDRASIAWLCFAVVTNGLCGTSRQIAWLGTLVIVPSTLWLLRSRRRVFLAGAAVTIAGALFIFACMEWLKHQPYVVPEHLLPKSFPVLQIVRHLTLFFLDAPFLILPLFAVFLPVLWRRNPRRSFIDVVILCVVYAIFSIHRGYPFLMEPLYGDWVDPHGFYADSLLKGIQPIYLPNWLRLLFTIASLGGLLGLIGSFFRRNQPTRAAVPSHPISWNQLAALLVPFAVAYIILLLPRVADGTSFDRYLLPLLAIASIPLVRHYQETIRQHMPLAGALLVVLMAIYAVTTTHNMFSFYRARVALASHLAANGIPAASVDNGWEYNIDEELQHAPAVNFPNMAFPANAYVPQPPPPPGPCQMKWYDYTPHIHAIYGVSFDPTACFGPAPFAPVHYSRWPQRTPGSLYVVRYLPSARQ
jgi:Dolichyl-phosphate-mannose-protein mannosyltransferase